MRQFFGRPYPGLASFLVCATLVPLPAQTFRTLWAFNETNGYFPESALIQGANGDFFGTTLGGGTGGDCEVNGNVGCGTVFNISAAEKLTTLHSFVGSEGQLPYAGLVMATDGQFYGTASGGGAYGFGTVFQMTPAGVVTPLYSFSGDDGGFPGAALVEVSRGVFYGTTQGGYIFGTIFKISAGGQLTTLHTFAQTDGQTPLGLVVGGDGNLYGTTVVGGANNYGTVFKMTPGGTLTTLHDFSFTDGAYPYGVLVQGQDGSFYGTSYGGLNQSGCYEGCGTIYRITPSGEFTSLYQFCAQTGCPDGNDPEGGLIQATDGAFYGTTYEGGAGNAGSIFRVTPSGVLTTLFSFSGFCCDGPAASLFQATNGELYGTTLQDEGYGTIFSLSLGLGPFVEMVPAFGNTGAKVRILGTDLTGTSSVNFNGTPAVFTVNNSGGAIATTVPDGATSGPVQVVTPNGTLDSSVVFQVR